MKCVTCGVDKHESEFSWRWKAFGIKQKSGREASIVTSKASIIDTRRRRKNGSGGCV